MHRVKVSNSVEHDKLEVGVPQKNENHGVKEKTQDQVYLVES